MRGFQLENVAAVPALSFVPQVWMAEHLEAWRAAFRAFGSMREQTFFSLFFWNCGSASLVVET